MPMYAGIGTDKPESRGARTLRLEGDDGSDDEAACAFFPSTDNLGIAVRSRKESAGGETLGEESCEEQDGVG